MAAQIPFSTISNSSSFPQLPLLFLSVEPCLIILHTTSTKHVCNLISDEPVTHLKIKLNYFWSLIFLLTSSTIIKMFFSLYQIHMIKQITWLKISN